MNLNVKLDFIYPEYPTERSDFILPVIIKGIMRTLRNDHLLPPIPRPFRFF
ncbi:MAG: hypothetical protein RBG13Loki_1462 [Promethearchaeota archaeon CR_4]|nr:MAG: hypothetical protein RBG13Loki_1462 [Candidatus Lokiarchaeota archaeon CR_4]